jgi:hypothetical protein
MVKNFREQPLVGPHADERGDRKRSVHELCNEEGQPLYYALLSNPSALRLDQEEVRQTKAQFRVLAETFPHEVRSLEGKSLDEVRSELENLQDQLEERAAA